MSTTSETTVAALPEVPLTIEGSSVLHQMMRIRWAAWRNTDPVRRAEIVNEAAPVLEAMEGGSHTACYSVLGHKADLLFVHFRESFEELKAIELQLARLAISEYLEPAHSYLSMVELSLYESSVKTFSSLASRGIAPHSPEWAKEVQEVLERQKAAMRSRLYPDIPPARYVCFYPMDRKRGEDKNWYTLPITDRQRQMNEHGLVGRRYADSVKQIISGSIGFDDWEWGVDLFAEDPLWFKKIIYEMRFDEASAVYGLFGPFYVGIRFPGAQLARLLEGNWPA